MGFYLLNFAPKCIKLSVAMEREERISHDVPEDVTDEELIVLPQLTLHEETGFVSLTEEGVEPWMALIQRGNIRVVFERLYEQPGEAVDITDIPNPASVLRNLRLKLGEDPKESQLIEGIRTGNTYYAVLNAQTPYTSTTDDSEQTSEETFAQTKSAEVKQSQEDFYDSILQSIKAILLDPTTPLSAVIEHIGPSPATGEPLLWYQARGETLRVCTKIRARVQRKTASELEEEIWSTLKDLSGYKRNHEVIQNFVPEFLNWFYRQYEKELLEKQSSTQNTVSEPTVIVDQVKLQTTTTPITTVPEPLTVTPPQEVSSPKEKLENRYPTIDEEIKKTINYVQARGLPAKGLLPIPVSARYRISVKHMRNMLDRRIIQGNETRENHVLYLTPDIVALKLTSRIFIPREFMGELYSHIERLLQESADSQP
jgi:hypothetical protein